jgi:pilus assembly protein CpaE
MSPHVLFVDDEEQIRKLLSAYFRRQGYEVDLATDGYEALKMIRTRPPDVLITDVGMPNMNGYDLTRRLRSDHRTARIPIVMLSARRQAEDILTGYAEGADEYVAKPVEMAVLAAKVEVLLKRLAATGGEAVQRRGHVVLFLHGKGGTGATTLAVNAAVALSETKIYRVALLDLALEFANAHMQLDLRPAHTLAELAGTDPDTLDDDHFQDFMTMDRSGVRVVTASDRPEQAELVTVPLVQRAIERLRAASDYVVVDGPAAFTQTLLAAFDVADAVVLVTEPHLASMFATQRCLDVLEQLSYPKERTLLVLNHRSQAGVETDKIARFFNRRPDLVVPFTPVFDEAADRGRPLVVLRADNAAANVMRDLAAQLTVLAPAGR